MTTDATVANIQLDPAGRIAREIPCFHCGYNLRTLRADQACPECSRPVQASLHRDRLQFSDPAWLARLTSGMTWTLAGFVLWLVDILAVPLLLVFVLDGWTQPGRQLVWMAAALLASLVPVVGAWKATSPEPRPQNTRRRPNTRAAARWLLVASVLLLAAGHISYQFGHPGPFWYLFSMPETISLLQIPGWFAFTIYLAQLARRIPACRLALCTLLAAAILALVEIALVLTLPAVVLRLVGPSYPMHLLALRTVVWLIQVILLLTLAIVYRRQFHRQANLADHATPQPDTIVYEPV